MSKITFSKEPIEKLNRNPYVKRVSEKSITYSDEFKRMFIEKYLRGNKPKTIFIEAGFDVEVIGIKRYEQAAARWIRSYNKDGIVGLRDTRTENAGRPSSTPLSKDAIINKQEAKIKLLEEQLELLKKFDMTKRRLVNNYVNLTNNEVIVGKKIQRIMRKYSIVCTIRKANPYRIMSKATKEHRVVPNLLQRNFKQGIPGKILLTDITYIPYGINQMAYLSVIKDSSSNDILAYHVSDRITLDIATTTIYKLISLHKHTLHKDAFIHSDQGVHYTSPKFQKLLRENNLGQSMSRRGNRWDSAPQESFFCHMKDEVNFTSCFTLEDVINKIDDYIDYYNNHRCQWRLKKMTPKQFRNHLLDVA
ncbi:IS3 family transposase [Clostridium botulinum]|nr:IS3 family transposase [Clostridium botulinum]